LVSLGKINLLLKLLPDAEKNFQAAIDMNEKISNLPPGKTADLKYELAYIK